jgi:hypothetical protein
MKKTIFTLALIAFVSGPIISTFGQEPDSKSEKARENLSDAKKNEADAKNDLKIAKTDSISSFQQFKNESNSRIVAHNKSIADFKVRIAKEKKENRAQYEKKLAQIEQKNTDLKKRLDDYKEAGNDKWISFKVSFNKDMDVIEKSLINFTIGNKI